MAIRVWRRSGLLILLLALVGAPVFGAGFSIFEQGAKAMGMGGAFVAQADDGSALFYNPGGLAFFDHNLYSVGVTYITTSKANFRGADPFPGASARGEQNSLQAFPPHAYWIHPMTQRVKFGLALNSPFGLTTDWKNPNQWAGRFLST
ncbi:MAG TPA: outer membrane protein transport protein, partial [Thermoanaerobaculia bacterium]|nr:outer membrane protein transport protein [Thermoanaerobaculia bacterium]